MSVKNLVCNKLARQNIFCSINSISILVILIYWYHYSCSSYYYYHYYYYYYHYYYYFVVVIIVLSMLFILFFIVHITMIFVCDLVWRVCVPSFFVFFSLMIHSIYSHCSYISSISYMSSSLSFSFLSTLLVIGGEFSKWIRAAWSTPTHWLLWVSRRVSIFFVSYSLVTTVEVLTPSFIFIIWHHLIMMPRRQGM